MSKKTCGLTGALLLLAAATSAHAGILGSSVDTRAVGACAQTSCFHLDSTIAFSSSPFTQGVTTPAAATAAAEIYLMNPDGTNPRRLTDNAYADAFANLSPLGTQIVFDSNRLTAGTVCDGTPRNNISDLFLMDADGVNQTLLTRGSSASWSPDGTDIAFHASASYYASGGLVSGCPIKADPGAATTDSDIFVAKVDDAGVGQPVNVTNTPDQIEDDPDWSPTPTAAPNGQSIVFTAHPITDNPNRSNLAEIYVMNPDGSDRQQLTFNSIDRNGNPTLNPEEERAPAWSPDGTRIVYSCRIGGGAHVFQICVMNADGTNVQQLTNDSVSDLTATWSPDRQQIVFHKVLPPLPATFPGEVMNFQLFVMNSTLKPDGSRPTANEITCAPQQNTPPYPYPCPQGITPTAGINLLGHWGVLRVHG